MKNTAKLLAFILAIVMVALPLVSCADNGSDDLAYVKGNGKLIIGITYFAPMDYFDTDGTTLIGFDHDFAAAVCEKLGLEPVFQEINWDTKETELAAKSIDCIWNGMTRNEEREVNMSLSDNYMKNRQVVVIRKENADAYKTAADLASKPGAAEDGSAGMEAIQANEGLKDGLVATSDQAAALTEVKAKTSEYCVIDSVMAKYLLASEGDFADLMIVEDIVLADDEFYAIAFRKGSDITAEVNKVIDELIADGTFDAIAAKYSLSDVIVK